MELGERYLCSRCLRELEEEGVCPFCGHDPDAEQEDTSVLVEGTTLQSGRYLLGAMIGRGGFGITYAAWDRSLQAPMAIKEYFPMRYAQRNVEESDEITITDEGTYRVGLRRFGREARVLSTLQNVQGVVKVYDWFEDNNTGYIVMEYVRGVTLDVYVRENRVGAAQLFAMLREPIDALAAIHHQGVLHRDISPNNMMVGEDGHIKIIDFGAAAVVERQKQGQDQTIMLTKSFAALEQYDNTMQQGQWTDVYGLSATLYTLVTGEMPPESVLRQRQDTLKSPRETQPGISRRQAQAIVGGLAVDPKRRIQSVDEFRSILYNLPMPEEVIRRRRFVRKVTAFASVLLTLMVLMLINETCGFPLGEKLLYALHVDGLHVVGALGSQTDREIPSSRLFLPVSAIGEEAFAGEQALESVTIPGSVKRIGHMAFDGCEALGVVRMEEGVEEIGRYAFSGCTSLEEIAAPESLTEIGERAFMDVPDTAGAWCRPGGQAASILRRAGLDVFAVGSYEIEENSAGVTLVRYDAQGESLTLPSVIEGQTVSAISENAAWLPQETKVLRLPDGLVMVPAGFATDHGNLREVRLGSGTRALDSTALRATAVSSLILPEGFEYIGDEALMNTPLMAVEIPSSVTVIGHKAFYGTLIEQAIVPDSVTWLGDAAFMCCTWMTYAELGTGAQDIPKQLFRGCARLEEVVIPEGVRTIGYESFAECDALRGVILPESMEEIGQLAFRECSRLETIQIPPSVTTIHPRAFIGCPNDLLIIGRAGSYAQAYAAEQGYRFEDMDQWNESVLVESEAGVIGWREDEQADVLHLPDSRNGRFITTVSSLKGAQSRTIILPHYTQAVMNGALAGNAVVEVVEVGDHLTQIGSLAFAGCSSLRKVDLPEGLVDLGISAFAGCVSLEQPELPEGLEILQESVFFGCRGITELNVPAALSKLPNGSFGCTGLREVTVPGSISICESAFYGCESLKTACLQEGVRSMWGTFKNCSALETVTIPSTVRQISRSTFEGCTSLTDVTILSMDTDLDYRLNDVGFAVMYDVGESEVIHVEDKHSGPEHLFADCPQVTIHAYEGSTAHAYALEHGLNFEAIR